MKRIIIDEPWLKKILPRGWPTGTSTVVTGAGRSGRRLIGRMLAAHWLRQGGSVVFMPLQAPSYDLLAEGLRRVSGVDVADHTGRVAFVQLDFEMDGMVVESPGRIRANLVRPEIWDRALGAAWSSVPDQGPGILLVASALNILLFSPTHADALLVPGAFGLVFVLVGFVTSGRSVGFEPYLLDLAPEDQRTMYVGINGTLNVFRVLLPILGGALMDVFGFTAAFVLTSEAMGVALLFLGNTAEG